MSPLATLDLQATEDCVVLHFIWLPHNDDVNNKSKQKRTPKRHSLFVEITIVHQSFVQMHVPRRPELKVTVTRTPILSVFERGLRSSLGNCRESQQHPYDRSLGSNKALNWLIFVSLLRQFRCGPKRICFWAADTIA